MPKNKAAAYRYRLIDSALRNTGRRWTFETLLHHVQQQLYENYDVEGCSRRTLENDISLMRKAPPEGFGAPIKRAKGEIWYTDSNYSIHDQPLIESDIKNLEGALGVLEQFKGLPHAGQILQIVEKVKGVLKMPGKDWSEKIIYFDHNDNLVGLNWLDPLFNHIRKKEELIICYHPFSEKKALDLIFHPYFLKEYNNRWFLIGRNVKEKRNWVLALDRIVSLNITHQPIPPNGKLNWKDYFANVRGVTIPENKEIEKIRLRLAPHRAPYVKTKPIHFSQKVLEEDHNGQIIIEVKMIINKELISELLAFGPDLEVLKPDTLRQEMKSLIEKTKQLYS